MTPEMDRAEVYQPIGLPSESDAYRISSSSEDFGPPPVYLTYDVTSSAQSKRGAAAAEAAEEETDNVVNGILQQRGALVTEIEGFSVVPTEDDQEEQKELLFDTTTTSHHQHQTRGVLNSHDDRHLHLSTSYPFSATGKLVWSNGVFCSAALVGPRHIATVRHCAPSGADSKSISVRFLPAFDNTARLGGSSVTHVITPNFPLSGNGNNACEWRFDWAVMVLDAPLGNSRGWFGVRAPIPQTSLDNPRLTTQGWPGDLTDGQRPFWQTSRTVSGKDSSWCDGYGPLITDCDAAGGQSGSAVWERDGEGRRWIYGMLSVTSSRWTAAASGLDWVNAVRQARRAYP